MAVVAAVIGLLLLRGAASWDVEVTPDILVHMNDLVLVPFTISDIPYGLKLDVEPISNNDVAKSSVYLLVQNETSFSGFLNITGVFLGTTELTFNLIGNGVSDREMDN